MRVVLVTGATGFIGSALRKALQDHELGKTHRFVFLSSRAIDGCDTLIDKRDANGRYSFSEEGAAELGLAELDTIIHLGAFFPRAASEADSVDQSTSNVVNTHYLLKHLPIPRRFVFASSIDVYGRSPSNTEDAAPQPSTLYGASKLFCERMLRSWAREHQLLGSSLTILRIGHLYGAGEEAHRKFIPETIRQLLSGAAPSLVTSGSELRSFMHVGDCCKVLLESIGRDDMTGTINVASANIASILETARILTSIVRDELGMPVPEWAPPSGEKGTDVVVDVAKLRSLFPLAEVEFRSGLRDEILARSHLP